MKKTNKLISILLTAAMIFAIAPLSAFAAEGDVASVTDKNGVLIGTYQTFDDAEMAARKNEDSTLTLLDDIILSDTAFISSRFTIDLNGKTMSCATGYALYAYTDTVLTIKDSGTGGTLQTDLARNNAIINDGTLIFESGNVKGGGIWNRGTLTFKNGKIESGYMLAIENSDTAYIYDGVFDATDSNAIACSNDSTTYIYNGKITGNRGIISKGNTYIYGGEFKGISNAAIEIADGTAEVTGGSFTGTDYADGRHSGTPYGEWTVENYSRGTLTFKGGEFPNGFVSNKSAAYAFLPEGYHFRDEGGKLIEVAEDAKTIDGYAKVSKGADLSEAVMTFDKEEYTYTGSEIKPTVTVTVGGKALTEGKDYTLTYANNINIGTATVTAKAAGQTAGGIAGSGNGNVSNASEVTESVYTGEITKGFSILKIVPSAEMFILAAPENPVYDGTAKYATVEASPEISGMGEITVSYYQNGEAVEPVNAGTYTVKVSTAESDIYSATNDVEVGSFEITKADNSATAAPAPNTLTYNGEAQNLVSAGEATGGTMVYSLDGAEYSEAIPTGTDAGDYTVYYKVIGDNNHNDTEPEAVTVTINRKDISDGFIILGDALTYNGTEQTQTVEKVLATGIAPEVTYTVSGNKATNVGVYLLTVTGTGNFSGEAKIAYEIAVDMNGVDFEQLHPLNVKATDKEKIEYIYNQLDNAFRDYADTEKRNEWDNDKSYCVELLKMIESVANHIESFKNDLAKYDINTVTSYDDVDLESLYNDEVSYLYHYYFDNLTEEQTKELDNILSGISALQKRISDVAKEIERIENAANSYDKSAVKTTDKADLEQLVADIKVLTDGQNLTADERAKLENLDATVDALLAKIAETTAEYNRVIDAANSYDEATATSADKDALIQLDTDIFALALTNNVTADEKNSLMLAHSNVFFCIQRITYVSEEIKRIVAELEKYVFESVKSSDKADIEQLIADIKALLDTQNITADERALLEGADETCDELIAKIDETVAEISRINDAANAYDIDTVTSDDKADIEKLIADIKALTDGDNITEDERAALEADDTVVDALVEKLAEVAEDIKKVDEGVKSYDEETIKSTDKEDLEQLKDDIQSLIDSTNTTENEKTALEEMIKDIEGLEEKIEEIKQQLEDIGDFKETFNPETVTSDDKAAIEETVAEIEAVNPDNLTDEQKAEYDEIKADLEALIEEIAAAEKAVADIGVELEMYGEDRVTIFWEDDIEALKAKIDELLADDNMGTAEKAKLNEYKAQAEKLIEIINTPKEYFSLRFFYFIWDCLTWKYNGILWLFSKIFGC